MPRASLFYSLAALAGVVAFGTVGFTIIEGWSLADSLYMTVMTVTTVGYGPPLPLSPAGRNFSIFFMVLGVGTAGYLLSTAVQSLVRSEILAAYGERRRQRETSKLKGHYIICGAGRVGCRIVGEMIFNPSGDTQIRAGDMLIGIGRAESMQELDAQARGRQYRER